MEKFKLVGKADLEQLNASELVNVKGGVNAGVADRSAIEDSQHHDSDNNDTFKSDDTEN